MATAIQPLAASSLTPSLPSELTERGPSSRSLAVAALVLAALAAAAMFVDMPIARWIRAVGPEHAVPGDLARFVVLSEAFAYGGTVGLIILTAVLLDPRGWRVAPRLALGAYGTGIVADIGKQLVARLRPGHANLEGDVSATFVGWLPSWNVGQLSELGLVPGYSLRSFPSGHTSTAFGLALALGTLYPRGRWLFLAIASLSAFQRIQSQSHFLSDVLVAAGLACLVAAFLAPDSPIAGWLNRLEKNTGRQTEGNKGNEGEQSFV